MKRSKKKLAIAALLAGSVVVSATSCHKSNPTVYGPPEEFQTQQEENGDAGTTGAAGEANSASGITNEAGTISVTGETNGVFVPDDNMNEDVYGPPDDFLTEDENGEAGEANEDFDPDDNTNAPVYGPPEGM